MRELIRESQALILRVIIIDMHAPARVCNVTPRLLVLRIVVDGEHNFLTFVNKFPGMRGRQWLNIALGALLVLLCECKIMSIGEKVKGVWEMFVCVCSISIILIYCERCCE